MKNIGQLKVDVSRYISPAKPSDSRDLNGAITQASEMMLSFVKPKELSKRVIIENALYDQVNKYTCPDDLDTNKIMQWYRLDGGSVDTWTRQMKQVSNRNFDSTVAQKMNDDNIFTIEYQSGVKFIKVANNQLNNTGLTIHRMDSLSENGLWQGSGNITNLETDNLTYITGSGSVRFDINTSLGTGSLFNNSLEAVDISEYLNVGKIFTWLDLPNKNGIQSITLKLQTSPSDYYSITVDSPHNSPEFQEGSNLLGFALDRLVMNTIGNPDPKNINAISYDFVTNGVFPLDSVRMDNIVARKGEVYGIQYISNRTFQDVQTGEMLSRPNNDNNAVLLEYDTYQLLVAHLAYVLGNELLQRENDIIRLEEDMNKQVIIYKKRHKEEYIDETQTLRKFGVRYGNIYGERWNNYNKSEE